MQIKNRLAIGVARWRLFAYCIQLSTAGCVIERNGAIIAPCFVFVKRFAWQCCQFQRLRYPVPPICQSKRRVLFAVWQCVHGVV